LKEGLGFESFIDVLASAFSVSVLKGLQHIPMIYKLMIFPHALKNEVKEIVQPEKKTVENTNSISACCLLEQWL